MTFDADRPGRIALVRRPAASAVPQAQRDSRRPARRKSSRNRSDFGPGIEAAGVARRMGSGLVALRNSRPTAELQPAHLTGLRARSVAAAEFLDALLLALLRRPWSGSSTMKIRLRCHAPCAASGSSMSKQRW
jgi:hypothetical protein